MASSMIALSDELKVLKSSKLLNKFNVNKHVEEKIESVSLNLASILPGPKFGKQIALVQNFKKFSKVLVFASIKNCSKYTLAFSHSHSFLLETLRYKGHCQRVKTFSLTQTAFQTEWETFSFFLGSPE